MTQKRKRSSQTEAGKQSFKKAPDPGQIGRVAEALFDDWAARAGVGVERFFPDGHGLDRWIELPAVPISDELGLDSAPPKVRACLQIKGTTSRKSIAVTLKNWQRLVEMDSPAFFFCVFLDEDLVTQTVHLVHVGEDEIGRTLAELRKRTWRDVEKLNRVTLGIRCTDGSSLKPPTPERFVESLRQLVGDPAKYAALKRDWRDRVGYDSQPHRIRMKITASPEELAYASVDDDTELQGSVTDHTSIRFGIERPVADGIPKGSALIRLSSKKSWSAEIRVEGSGPPVTIRGQLRVPLLRGVQKSRQFLRFASPALLVDLRGTSFESMTLHHRGLKRLDERFELRVLAEASRALRYLIGDRGRGELWTEGRRLNLTPDSVPGGASELLRHAEVCEWALAVADAFGVPDRTEATPSSIIDHDMHYGLWGAYLNIVDSCHIFVTPTSYEDGPARVTLPCFAPLGEYVLVQCLSFLDPVPTRAPDGTVRVHAVGETAGPKHLLRRGYGLTHDLVASLRAFETEMTGRGGATFVCNDEYLDAASAAIALLLAAPPDASTPPVDAGELSIESGAAPKRPHRKAQRGRQGAQ